jgi:uncharacterized protein YbbK (DUF523 family)/uncharacterized protein YbgA (DUF1722 family)
VERSLEERPRIGISACLLGDEVRFDGGHKRDPFLTEILSPHVDWVRVCPEVEVGMGTPREPVRLVRSANGSIRMLTVNTGIDYTKDMRQWARGRLRELAAERLSGYVLKKNSPSCGMERVKLVSPSGRTQASGRGLFAGMLMTHFPNLPVEEEGRLADPRLRRNFIERVFAYQRLRSLFDGEWTRKSLAAFHDAHRLTLMAHSRTAHTSLGRLLASTKGRGSVREEYERGFMRALAVPASVQRHTAVMRHLAARVKGRIDAAAMRELAARIDEYRRGRVPLVVPQTLVRHHAAVLDDADLLDQTYLNDRSRIAISRVG